MSSTIWTQCEGKSRLAPLSATAYRIVEDQSKNSTRKLVDSDPEQARLEELIEGVKPRLPQEPGFENLHYLLATPFRYSPLRPGSRFRRRNEAGVWYGADSMAAALAEKAYYRLRFLMETDAELSSEVVLTSFHIGLQSTRAVDLTQDPFAAFTERISNPLSYAESQPLGTDMRRDHVIFSRYRSARDPQKGTNVAVFSALAFSSKTVSDHSRENWYCFATRDYVEFRSLSFSRIHRTRFLRNEFEVKGQFPILDLQ